MPEPAPTAFELSPKKAFLSQTDLVQLHNNFVASGAAERGLAAALAEMTLRQMAADPIARAHNASKLEGAREFLAIWMNLGRAVKEPQTEEMRALKPLK